MRGDAQGFRTALTGVCAWAVRACAQEKIAAESACALARPKCSRQKLDAHSLVGRTRSFVAFAFEAPTIQRAAPLRSGRATQRRQSSFESLHRTHRTTHKMDPLRSPEPTRHGALAIEDRGDGLGPARLYWELHAPPSDANGNDDDDDNNTPRASAAAAATATTPVVPLPLRAAGAPLPAAVAAATAETARVVGEYHSDEELQRALEATTDEKEAKRLKRLLRNRVSAQQARERKRAYVDGLEGRAITAEKRCSELEASVARLEAEAAMLRKVIQNMRASA